MPQDIDVPVSTEAELDREMSAIIARWVDRGGVASEELDRYQELSIQRSALMHGGTRLLNIGRRRAAA